MIVEIDGGEFEKLPIVKAAVREKKTRHPVLWDERCQNTKRYGIRAWPVAYLIDVDGKVVWEGNPARIINRRKARAALLDRLEKELKRVKPGSVAAKGPTRRPQ